MTANSWPKGSNNVLVVIFLVFTYVLTSLVFLRNTSSASLTKENVYQHEFMPSMAHQDGGLTSMDITIANNIVPSTTTIQQQQPTKHPNFVVLLTCSYGFFDMWKNWLAFFAKLQLQNLPVHLFAEDRMTYNRCRDQVAKGAEYYDNATKVDLSCLSFESVFSEKGERVIGALGYRKKGYVEMMSHRPFIVQKELEKGYDVIFSDLDAVWLKSPLPYFENELYSLSNTIGIDESKQINIWAQVDPSSAAPLRLRKFPNLCPGFMVYRSSPRTIELVKKWGEVTAQGEHKKRNQGPFNSLIWESKKFNVSKVEAKALHSHFFVTGKSYFEEMTEKQRKEVVIAHNNGISGYDIKVQRMKNFSLWVVDNNDDG